MHSLYIYVTHSLSTRGIRLVRNFHHLFRELQRPTDLTQDPSNIVAASRKDLVESIAEVERARDFPVAVRVKVVQRCSGRQDREHVQCVVQVGLIVGDLYNIRGDSLQSANGRISGFSR